LRGSENGGGGKKKIICGLYSRPLFLTRSVRNSNAEAVGKKEGKRGGRRKKITEARVKRLILSNQNVFSSVATAFGFREGEGRGKGEKGEKKKKASGKTIYPDCCILKIARLIPEALGQVISKKGRGKEGKEKIGKVKILFDVFACPQKRIRIYGPQ